MTKDYAASAICFSFEPDAPHNGTRTSVEAADAIKNKCVRARAAILEFVESMGKHGATDYEIQQKFGYSGDFERPRRWELVRKGHIYDSGSNRRHEGQRTSMIVWLAVPMRVKS